MRFYPLFVGTFFFCCLLLTVPLFYDEVVTRQIFERECGRPVSDYVCYKEFQNDACTAPNQKFANAEAELIKAFAYSPKIVQRATCDLKKINVIRYFDDAPGKLQQREGEISLSWSILRDWDFIFASRALWAHTGYAFKDLHRKYRERRTMWMTYERPEESEGLFNLGFMAAYHHEIAKQIAISYLNKDPQHCAAKARLYSTPTCKPVALLTQEPLAIDYDLDQGFKRQYDICTAENQFAQAFSAHLLATYLQTPYKIHIEYDTILDHQKLLQTELHQAYRPTIEALLSLDPNNQKALENFHVDLATCTMPVATQ